MSLLNKNEKKVRESMLNTLAVTQFLLDGGRVTVCKPQRNKVSRSVRAKEKLVFGSKTPVNRPCVMFDNVEMV
jgi:hypothetical protein